jgi:murein DD-endopeptidase MepM/ murein hydrolase activator NlpD
LLEVPVGVRRAMTRLRPDTSRPSTLATSIHRRSLALAQALRAGLDDSPIGRPRTTHPTRLAAAHRPNLGDRFVATFGPHRPVTRRGQAGPRTAAGRAVAAGGLTRAGKGLGNLLGRERVVPLSVAGLVLLASVVSVAPASGLAPTTGTRVEPRLLIGGGVLGDEEPPDAVADMPYVIPMGEGPATKAAGLGVLAAELDASSETPVGPYLADGTLMKPVAVDTTIADGRDRLTTYRVKSGDSLTAIANRFDVSMMTIWWANKLTAKDDLKVGQTLIIPPTNGLVVTVQPGDTIDAIASRAKVDKATIVSYNGLPDETVVIGQVLIVPGALGASIATPTPKPLPKPVARTTTRTTTRSSGGAVSGPAKYTGGAFAWPVAGGYISQYFHYGHYAIDIAGDYGLRIKAAAGGTVIFAGWKSNGGGYQVWISHGSGLYTTYNHMASVSVGRGQQVGKGGTLGRMGHSGWATGNHLHFEVWRGMPWQGGRQVNPLAYL